MPVKWHCPVTLSNARECFFSENGQTSLVTCTMTNVVKHMTHLILPRGPHRPWMGPVHPSPAPEFRTPRLPVINCNCPQDHPSWTEAGCSWGLTAALHPPTRGQQPALPGAEHCLTLCHTSSFSMLMLPVFPGEYGREGGFL